MSQIFTAGGVKIPVTVVQAGPCKVIQVKTEKRDGYAAVQIGYGIKKKSNRAQKGHQKDASYMYLREFRVPSVDGYEVGKSLSAADFERGEYVDASGIMKGRGFAGAVKRHGFHGAPATHGHDHPRAVGSIGSRFPQHTLKGTRMAGRMGGQARTVKNLVIVDIDSERNLLYVKGAIPGTRGGLVRLVTDGEKIKDFPPLFETPKAEAQKPDEPEVRQSDKSSPEAKAE